MRGACYPEGHPEAESLAADVANLRHKQQAGASHLVSQLFFDNGKYYRFLNMARKAGVTLPISAGVMPIVRRSQIERTVALSSASLPSAFTRMISRWQDDPQSLYQAGIEYAVEQLRDLIEGGADGVHLYAMNDAGVGRRRLRRHPRPAVSRIKPHRPKHLHLFAGRSCHGTDAAPRNWIPGPRCATWARPGWTPDDGTARLLAGAGSALRAAATPRGVWRRLPLSALPLAGGGARPGPATCRAAPAWC